MLSFDTVAELNRHADAGFFRLQGLAYVGNSSLHRVEDLILMGNLDREHLVLLLRFQFVRLVGLELCRVQDLLMDIVVVGEGHRDMKLILIRVALWPLVRALIERCCGLRLHD